MENNLLELSNKLFKFDYYEETYTVDEQDVITKVTHTETTQDGEPTAELSVEYVKGERQNLYVVKISSIKNGNSTLLYTDEFKSCIKAGCFLQEQLNFMFSERDMYPLNQKKIDICLEALDFDDLYNKFVDCFRLNIISIEIIEKFILDTDVHYEFKDYMVEELKGRYNTLELYDLFEQEFNDLTI